MSTIVALATPTGIGAIHVIRMSGSDAFEIINKVSVNPVEKTKDRIQVTFLKSRNGKLLDQVVLAKFYAPYSYTGEDCIEISCHGNNLISKLIIDELIKSGAVQAERGEFTKRAFLNNKIDLNQAINIGNLFNAKSEVDVYSSVEEIRGGSSETIKGWTNRLLNIISECELNIDYPPDIESDNKSFISGIRERLKGLFLEIEELLHSSKTQKLSNYRIVFIGKPNAGKSSLINRLIGKDRVIVSDVEGTTQDSVEVDFVFEGYLVTLVDTAGIHNEKDFEKFEAAKKSRKEIKNADLIIHLVSVEDKEINYEFFDGEIGNRRFIRIYSKKDLSISGTFSPSISSKTGDLESLFSLLRNNLDSHYKTIGIKSQEGINYLDRAYTEVEKSLEEDLPIDLIAEHLNMANNYLNRILGINLSSSEKINHMFDSFCVGK